MVREAGGKRRFATRPIRSSNRGDRKLARQGTTRIFTDYSPTNFFVELAMPTVLWRLGPGPIRSFHICRKILPKLNQIRGI